MRVLYILGSTVMSGATISFKVILEQMKKRNFEIVVLISKKNQNEAFISYLHKLDIVTEYFLDEYYIYPTISFFNWENSIIKFPIRFIRKLYNLFISERQVYSLIKKYSPDLVHTNVGVLWQGVIACKKLNLPHIWHLREYQTKDFGWKIMPSKKKFIQLLKTTNVICITRDILDYFNLENYDKAVAMWNGIYNSELITYTRNKQSYFLCANRISPEKRVEDVITSFASITKFIPDVKLLIVGDKQNKKYVTELETLINNLNCSNIIEIRAHQPDITELLENALGLIVASKNEGLGRMTLEASFMGCLVIGRNTGGTKEIIEATGGGFLFNNNNELAELIVDLSKLTGTDFYRNKILEAQKVVLDRCSIENYGNKLYQLYIDVLTHA